MAEIVKKSFFMPVMKAGDGRFVGILSDTSQDRDSEFMSKELLDSWALNNKSLKALANHTNKMESWVGGWSNLRVVNKNGHSALVAEPWFFSKEANPLADQVRRQVEEALDKGENAGISIGAINPETKQVEKDGALFNVYTKAELVEATWVPIQSNRNASFGHIAKQFDFEVDNMRKEEVVEEKPQEEVVEENPVEEKKEESPEKVEDAPEEEAPEEEKEEGFDAQAELESAKSKIAELEKQVKDLKEKSVNLPRVEKQEEIEEEIDDEPATVERMLAARLKK